MVDAEHRRQVLRTLEKQLARDHAKTTVYDFSPLGLVEMTRKRTVESLKRQLSEPCHECGGRGMVKTAETVTYEVFREVVRGAPVRCRTPAGDRLAEGGGADHRRGINAVAELEEFSASRSASRPMPSTCRNSSMWSRSDPGRRGRRRIMSDAAHPAHHPLPPRRRGACCGAGWLWRWPAC